MQQPDRCADQSSSALSTAKPVSASTLAATPLMVVLLLLFFNRGHEGGANTAA